MATPLNQAIQDYFNNLCCIPTVCGNTCFFGCELKTFNLNIKFF